MVMIGNRSRSRDIYHLSALIAHQQPLDPTFASDSFAACVPIRKRRTLLSVTSAIAAATLALVTLIGIGTHLAVFGPSRIEGAMGATR